MSWLSRHATAIQTASAAATVLVAVAALIGVKLQLDGADRVQREQSAREAYRSHLALATGLPAFAAPQDACALMASEQEGAYIAFVDHLLYSAEQMLAVSDGWDASFRDELLPHRDYLCSAAAPKGDTQEIIALLAQFRDVECAPTSGCQ
ncbi:hypothetical protein H4P12_05215 [Paracoccus sp. 11-3]|uniref:Uncharacterized protein n=1 Tax=Paracoccus amoyensis TaxID=2760093 RepID=A0A926GD43_9RHOB|nr:hypothetical protein [Paracoccus amoyensis]MBC9246122.1 hypothetical protein [Paracoccus amoyensis]